MKKIKEIIVVEGRDDEAVVKRAIEADVIQTHGYSYGEKLKNHLKKLSKTRGIIIFTDPDYVGKRIRRDLSDFIPEAKHAFLPVGKSIKDDDIGVENASPEDVREAILNARPEYQDYKEEFSKADIFRYGLSGKPHSKDLREKLAYKLGIGYGNGNHFLIQLNSFGIKRKDLEMALEEIKNESDIS